MKLYGYWRSSSAWRVRIALELKGLKYDYVAVHLLQDEQNAPAYRELNPMRQVPVLELDDAPASPVSPDSSAQPAPAQEPVRIAQSLAIITYLEERTPTPALFPADPIRRALALQMVEIVNSGIQPLQNTSVMAHLSQVAPGLDWPAWVRHFQARGLAALERLAAQHVERFLLGPEPSVADLYLIPQLYGCRRHDLDLGPYPTLLRVEAECSAVEAFVRAHAERQPDAVPDGAR
jgi:maleylpyruvate isomerase